MISNLIIRTDIIRLPYQQRLGSDCCRRLGCVRQMWWSGMAPLAEPLQGLRVSRSELGVPVREFSRLVRELSTIPLDEYKGIGAAVYYVYFFKAR